MIVDDSATFRKLLDNMLREAGYEVVEASDGEEALEKISVSVVDMVITDLTMPGMNGIELVREIRKREDYRSAPIILLTTEGQKERMEEGRQAGANGWIVKPFEPEELLSVIGKLLPC